MKDDFVEEDAEVLNVREHEETCQAIAEGFADIEVGRMVSFEDAWAGREARRAERQANLLKRTGMLET